MLDDGKLSCDARCIEWIIVVKANRRKHMLQRRQTTKKKLNLQHKCRLRRQKVNVFFAEDGRPNIGFNLQ